MKNYLLLFFIFSLISLPVIAIRIAPKEVQPVIHNDIKYIAPHWGDGKIRKQNGGYIEAWDIKKSELLWDLRIYKIKYNWGWERDIQDIFITSIEIQNNKLIVTNEENDIFTVDLKTKKVTPKNKVYKLKMPKNWWEFWK